ncbi:MAG: GlsB/YeaQ/YmgE family stress response membrane protein [Candidatus Omnitrophica bacterium]|nr:GlsB/YeaQ/YmgE family stress response membrane protein [Candidatus Omnitrophota bacterium]
MESNLGYWVGVLLMGGIIGWLAGMIVKGRGFGIVGDIAVGVVGAITGGFLFSVIGITTANLFVAFLAALAGAVLLVVVTRYFRLAA